MEKQLKILVLSHKFWPESSGSISCLQNIVKSLSKEYTVDVVCARTDIDSTMHERKFGCNINRIGSVYDVPYLINKRNQENNSILSFIVKVISYPLRKILRKRSVFFGENDGYDKAVIRYLEQNLSSYNYLVTMVFPRCDTNIVEKIKNKFPKIKWIILQFDMYAYNPSWPKESNLDRIKEQKKWYESADRIIIQHEMYNDIIEHEFKNYISKLLPLHIPSLDSIDEDKELVITGFLDRICKKNNLNKDDIITVVYTGRFYQDIRNPEYMLRSFEKICSEDNNIYLFILGFGCEDIVRKYKKILGNRLIVCGQTTNEDSVSAQREANILINISNSYREMVPSKILEYIGRRKPILNYYSIEDDICEEYLTEYPLHYSVDEREEISGNQIERIKDFILENYRNKCDYNDVKDKYNEFTSDYYTKKMMEGI